MVAADVCMKHGLLALGLARLKAEYVRRGSSVRAPSRSAPRTRGPLYLLVVITRAGEEADWLEEGSGAAARNRFSLPVTHIVVAE